MVSQTTHLLEKIIIAQGDVRKLPSGVRSLLVEQEKLLQEEWTNSSNCSKYQEKMAGFCVSVFSPDGKQLRVMSKHMAEGPFAELAEEILKPSISEEQQLQMAVDLFCLEATATGGCIAISQDC
eukprot:gene12096-8321_t